MKRDMDLIREILLWAEGNPPVRGSVPQLELADRDPWEVYGHASLLKEAGLLKASITSGAPPGVHIVGLTWEGHDFLDSIRDSGVWASVKKKLGEVGGSVPLELVKPLALQYLRQKLGLPDG